MDVSNLLARLGLSLPNGELPVRSPVHGQVIASVPMTTDVNGTVDAASIAFRQWRDVPAPRRGELVRLFGDELRRAKPDLALLITMESCRKAWAKCRR